jgi:hypothetical protein
VPVTAADEGNMDLVVKAAVGTLNDYDRTMDPAEIVQAWRGTTRPRVCLQHYAVCEIKAA